MKNQNKLYIGIIGLAIVAIVLGVLFIYGKNSFNPFNKLSNNVSDVKENIKLDFEILELAQTASERQMGYMNREKICSDCGMLFIFEQTQPLSFWMKNTLVPLYITFIDEKGAVINTGAGQPQVTTPSVSSLRSGKYVLEVPLDSKVKLNPGDVVDIEYMKAQGKVHSTIRKQSWFNCVILTQEGKSNPQLVHV
jgi:uncharacterized membrane protein (UPF0127 family)